jgi:hypothetical protein
MTVATRGARSVLKSLNVLSASQSQSAETYARISSVLIKSSARSTTLTAWMMPDAISMLAKEEFPEIFVTNLMKTYLINDKL